MRVALISNVHWPAHEAKARTKRQVDDDVVRPEVRRHVARRAREVGHGRAPVGRVDARRAVEDIAGGARVPRPEPDLHARARALHREEAAAVRVEVHAERVRPCVEHGAACVARRVDVAVRAHGRARHGPRAADRAACDERR